MLDIFGIQAGQEIEEVGRNHTNRDLHFLFKLYFKYQGDELLTITTDSIFHLFLWKQIKILLNNQLLILF
jgi:hypothetical protein